MKKNPAVIGRWARCELSEVPSVLVERAKSDPITGRMLGNPALRTFVKTEPTGRVVYSFRLPGDPAYEEGSQ